MGEHEQEEGMPSGEMADPDEEQRRVGEMPAGTIPVEEQAVPEDGSR